jgi:hypothetical protein
VTQRATPLDRPAFLAAGSVPCPPARLQTAASPRFSKRGAVDPPQIGDLGRGEADPVGGVHGLGHVVEQAPDLVIHGGAEARPTAGTRRFASSSPLPVPAQRISEESTATASPSIRRDASNAGRAKILHGEAKGGRFGGRPRVRAGCGRALEHGGERPRARLRSAIRDRALLRLAPRPSEAVTTAGHDLRLGSARRSAPVRTRICWPADPAPHQSNGGPGGPRPSSQPRVAGSEPLRPRANGEGCGHPPSSALPMSLMMGHKSQPADRSRGERGSRPREGGRQRGGRGAGGPVPRGGAATLPPAVAEPVPRRRRPYAVVPPVRALSPVRDRAPRLNWAMCFSPNLFTARKRLCDRHRRHVLATVEGPPSWTASMWSSSSCQVPRTPSEIHSPSHPAAPSRARGVVAPAPRRCCLRSLRSLPLRGNAPVSVPAVESHEM